MIFGLRVARCLPCLPVLSMAQERLAGGSWQSVAGVALGFQESQIAIEAKTAKLGVTKSAAVRLVGLRQFIRRGRAFGRVSPRQPEPPLSLSPIRLLLGKTSDCSRRPRGARWQLRPCPTWFASPNCNTEVPKRVAPTSNISFQSDYSFPSN